MDSIKMNFRLDPEEKEKYYSKILNLEVDDTDIFLSGFPKSGTNWAKEMIWLIAKDLDYEGAKNKILIERFPLMTRSIFEDFKAISKETKVEFPPYFIDAIKFFEEQQKPRFGCVHLPWDYMPRQMQNGSKKPRIIHIVRNPKDVVVSLYHYIKFINDTNETLQDFCESFLANSEKYWSNVFSYWEHRHEPNVLFIKYEDMKKDLPSVISKVADFFGKKLSQDQIDGLTKHLSFESMKNNKSVNQEEINELRKKANFFKGTGSHMRSGKVGEHKAAMSNDLVEKFNKDIEKHGKGLY